MTRPNFSALCLFYLLAMKTKCEPEMYLVTVNSNQSTPRLHTKHTTIAQIEPEHKLPNDNMKTGRHRKPKAMRKRNQGRIGNLGRGSREEGKIKNRIMSGIFGTIPTPTIMPRIRIPGGIGSSTII